jgi:hypothetical protein
MEQWQGGSAAGEIALQCYQVQSTKTSTSENLTEAVIKCRAWSIGNSVETSHYNGLQQLKKGRK